MRNKISSIAPLNSFSYYDFSYIFVSFYISLSFFIRKLFVCWDEKDFVDFFFGAMARREKGREVRGSGWKEGGGKNVF